jgi:hypothetical protein
MGYNMAMKADTKKKIGAANSGSKSGRWKGGSKSTDALHARKAWEKHTGRKIPKGYIVHHRDGNPENEELSNLAVVRRGAHNTIEKKGHNWKEQGAKVNKVNKNQSKQRKYR